MNTTEAAAQAGVTVPTVRTWCRMGAVKAVKAAGRWVIEAASLAHRIALGIRHTRKANPMDLNTSYSYVGLTGTLTTVTPKVRTRTTKDGITLTSVTGVIALLSDRIDAITDPGDRLHTLEMLRGISAVISDQPRTLDDGGIHTRDSGRLATTYHGTSHISTDDVLDLLEQIRQEL